MKKFLKSANLFIVAFIVAFGFTLNVFAEGECGDLGSNKCRVGERGVIKVSGSGFVYQKLTASTQNHKTAVSGTGDKSSKGNPVNIYSKVGITYKTTSGNVSSAAYFSSYKDSYAALYCLDAQYEGYNPLYAERFLLDQTSSKKVQAFDYAILSVLTGGGSGYITDPTSNIADYWARLMAIRAITYTFGFYNDANIEYKGAFYAGYTVLDGWLKSDSSAYDELNSALASTNAGSLKGKGDFSGHSSYSFAGTPVSSAQNYYNAALREAAEYLSGLTDGTKVETVEVVAGDVQTTGEKGNEFVSKDVVHTIKLSGFNKDSKFIINKNNNGIKYAEGTQYDGLTGYISMIEIENGRVFTRDTGLDDILGQDFVKLGYIAENQDVTIKITVHFEGWKTSTNSNITTLKCGQQPIKYSIDGVYSANNSGKYSDYVATIWYSGESQTQRYVGIEKGKNVIENPWESKYETYLIDSCSCDSLLEACVQSGNINSNECKELKEANCGDCTWLEAECTINPNSDACDTFNEVCDVTCDTTFDTFECCDEKGELIVSPLDDQEVSILGPQGKDIKACYVSKIDSQWQGEDKGYSGITGVKDQKGNTYTLGTMSENKYCSVSCKEDYVMTMPTAKLVNAGRYFTFKAKVEGTKVCYTNTIDINTYNKDIIERQVAMVDAYTEYLKWKALDEAPIQDREDHRSASPCCRECDPYTDENGKYHSNCHCTCDASDETNYWTEYYVSDARYTNYYVSEGNKNYNNGTISISSNSASAGYDNDGHVDGYCSSGCCYAHCTDGKDGSAATLAANIDAGLARAIKALKAAKEAYEATIREFAQCTDDTWTSEMNYDPDIYYDYEETYLNDFGLIGEMNRESYSEDADSETWYCKGEKSINNDYTTCSTGAKYSRNATLEDRAYKVCTIEGCVTETRPQYYKISTANFAKKTSNISASYKPATLFYNIYPSGEITVNKADDNVALENSLPVALNTKRGIYKYTVNVENLGEFYNTTSKNNLGRYVGSSTAVVDPDKLVYACSYLVNITKTDGWICDFDDTCTDDCISNCIGPNCDNFCDGVDCVADCVGLGCIYDEDAGTSLVEKTVSLNNLFPNGTDSYNWDKSKNDKALTTISEIESSGNSIYDTDPILSITIDPSTARNIKKYNDSVESEGGYSNSTISCEAKGGYEEIVCFSSFVTDLLDGKYGDNVINENSLVIDNNYRSSSSDYFKLWNGRVSENDMLGPSWK